MFVWLWPVWKQALKTEDAARLNSAPNESNLRWCWSSHWNLHFGILPARHLTIPYTGCVPMPGERLSLTCHAVAVWCLAGCTSNPTTMNWKTAALKSVGTELNVLCLPLLGHPQKQPIAQRFSRCKHGKWMEKVEPKSAPTCVFCSRESWLTSVAGQCLS